MARHFLHRLRPTQALVHDAVDATTWLISEGHESVARSVVGAVSRVPGAKGPVRAVDGVRRGITHGVLGTVRGVNRLVEGVSDAVLDRAGLDHGPEPAVPLRADRVVSAEGAMDQLVGVLNGAVGDHLADSDNGLDLGLRLRYGDNWLPTELPPSPTVVVLVHGLSTTELSWSLQADEAFGDPAANYGELLRRDLGYTPVFARYNTGLPVEQSGFALAEALDALLQAVDFRELVLVGHSMGGLVCRAATNAGPAYRWKERLTHMVCLGSPHGGAPLARFGERAAKACQAIDLPLTQIVGAVLERRSAGVKDLHHGGGLEACGPLLPHVRYLLVAGSLTRDPELFGTQWLGDMLVPVESAHAPGGIQVDIRHVGGTVHHRLQTHPQVYELLRAHLRSGRLQSPSTAGSTANT